MNFVRPEIERMAGYVPGEQPQSGKVVKLNTNENPYPPSPAVARAIEAQLQKGLSRYPDPMANGFRTIAADILGLPSKDWILCGNGSDDILTIVTRAIVGEKGLIRFPTPSYVLYASLATIQGARHEQIPFTKDWDLDERFWRPHPNLRLAVVPNPNSPTGTIIPKSRMETIASQIPCPLLIDEAYVDFAETDCALMPLTHENVFVSRTLSKSYALAGLRFGYLIAAPKWIEQFTKVKDSYNCDSLSIAGAIAAMGDREWLAENRSKVIRTRERMTQQLTERGYEVIPSEANFVWCVHPQENSKKTYQQLKRQGLLVRYMNYPNWGEGLRISVGTEQQLDMLLALLDGCPF